MIVILTPTLVISTGGRDLRETHQFLITTLSLRPESEYFQARTSRAAGVDGFRGFIDTLEGDGGNGRGGGYKRRIMREST
jgi:hypothetical protein